LRQGIGQMNTESIMSATPQNDLRQDGVPAFDFAFGASALPVYGTGTERCAGVALAFATDEAEACGEDRFALLLTGEDGSVIARLGPFCEEEVVAVWRDLSGKTGLPRMIQREEGGLSLVSRQIGRLALGTTRIRRRHGSLGERRPRFLTRRKTGRLPARPQIHRDENEIIARS